MSIDWFTTTAQILNFLILVWLLKKLLFRPIMAAMARRDQELTARLEHVKMQLQEAQAQKDSYEQQLLQLQKEKDSILTQTRQEAEKEKSALMQLLIEELQQKKSQFANDMYHEQQELEKLITRTLSEKALALSQKIITDLADQTLEQRMIEHFLQHLAELPEAEQTSIKLALQKEQTATIVTGFSTDTALRHQIQSRLDNFAPGSRPLFKQSKTLVCGIALEIGGRSWEWNIDRYLTELGTELLKPPVQTS